ncbi:recombinase family protein [Peribacillus asahii]|uniref:recombinase family protein n=1 Tax=Peribacillus asahii TaxID=228899 RepID=UPI00207A5673|nr:recombinase family protein [Peribacillus asahii]USK69191.1 recombinase family protein [Peribacillus asahii]
MEKVFGYVRVSTNTQVTKGQGIQTQVNAIQEYCKQNNYELVEVFKDEGISGTVVDREGITDLLASFNGINKVMVLNTSRLWRSDNAKVMIKRQLMKANAEVLSIEQPTYSIYDKDPNEFLINSMMELLDQYDRMNTNLKLAKGRRTKVKATGQKGCGIAPIGYKWNHEDDKPVIEIDEDTVEMVKDVFSKYLELKSIGKVKKYLDEKGYRTQRGKEFSPQAINNILTNDFYKGIVTHGSIVKEGSHEAIINKIIFGKVQSLLTKNKRKG